MPHIHTKPGQYDHTASAYIFRTDFNEPKIALHLHRILGKYMQFGGHIELHETPWQAIIHELKEEAGYDINQLRLLQPGKPIMQLTNAVVHPTPILHSSHPFATENTQHFHTDVAYAFITKEAPRFAPDEGESLDIKLFTRDEITKLSSEHILNNVREIVLSAFDNFLPEWQPISPAEFK